MKEKKKRVRTGAPRGDLPLLENGRIEIVNTGGGKELLILGVLRILSFGEERMAFSRRHDVVTVEGSGLFCTSYASGAVGIRGAVNALIFSGEVAEK